MKERFAYGTRIEKSQAGGSRLLISTESDHSEYVLIYEDETESLYTRLKAHFEGEGTLDFVPW